MKIIIQLALTATAIALFIGGYVLNAAQPSISADVAIANVNGGEIEAVAVRKSDKAIHTTSYVLFLGGVGCLLGVFFLRTQPTHKKS